MTNAFRSVAAFLGGAVLGLLGFLGGLGLVARDVARIMALGVFRSVKVGGPAFAQQCVRAGVRAVPIVMLVNFFIGVILALIGGNLLQSLGVQEYLGDLLGFGMALELGPLITGIIMTGFIGAALAAEIGTMVVSDEITALRTMSIDPMRHIVAPRLLAVVVMVPALTVMGIWIGMVGGFLIADQVVGVGWVAYWEHVWDSLDPPDVWRGLTKAGVFALIIGTIGCYQGFRVSGGAEGVGRVTTQAVVRSIVAIIVSDAMLNYFLLFRT